MTGRPALAPDPVLAQRDELLDERRVRARLDELLGGGAFSGFERVERVRVKYRLGRSMSLLWRAHANGVAHLISARAFGGGEAARNYERARADAPPAAGPLRPVAYAPDLETVFWVFPRDRRIDSLELLRGPNDALERLVGAACRPELVAYAPEKAATARCVGAGGEALAYVKVYAGDAGARAHAIHRALGGDLEAAAGRLRLPRALGYDPTHRALAIEPAAGERLALGSSETGDGGVAALGAALAGLHEAPPPPELGALGRLGPERLHRAAELIAAARPDAAVAAFEVAAALASSFEDDGERVCLHGDAHCKNAVAGPGPVTLIDLDQAALGPSAADLGSVLAGLRSRRCLGRLSGGRERGLATALLRGYGSVRAVPSRRSLEWHTAASLLAERALRAVTRVRPDGLEALPAVLAAARRRCPAPRRAVAAPRSAHRARRRPALLLYCQHTVGLGHLTRSLALAAALAERFSVVVLSGGAVPRAVTAPDGVELVRLPPLARDPDAGVVSAERGITVERAQALRRRMITGAVRGVRPAAVVVELFPFGRRAFTGEIVALIEEARSLPGGRAVVVSSLRDILVGRGAKQAAYDERACGLANAHLDAVLVHADPRFARLEESFRPRSPLRVPVHYTGFVANGRSEPEPGSRRDRIVVSAGGGAVGEGLVRAAVDAQPALWRANRMPMRAIAGPFLPERAWGELRAAAMARPGLDLRRAVPDLGAELRSAGVSVSQCGYNTALDVLRARVPALVVPYRAPGEDEQARRADRLAALGVVRVLDPAELDGATLAAAARELVGTVPSKPDLDLDGARTSAELLAELVAGAPRAAAGVSA